MTAVSCILGKVEMEGLSGAQSSFPGTSSIFKDSSKNASSSPGALAPSLRTNNTISATPEALKLHSTSSGSSKTSTRYRTTLCEPEFLNLIRSSEVSEIDPSTGAELDQNRDTENSDGLEIVKSTDSVDDSSSSQPGVHFLNLSDPQIHEKFIRHITLQRSQPPNMGQTLTTFQTRRSSEDVTSGEPSTDEKFWNLGFKARIFQQSYRDSPTNTAKLVPYRMHADQRTFDLFHTKVHRHAMMKAAWCAIQSTMSPNLKTGALSPGFDKLADDFFGGKGVREECEYGPDGIDLLIEGPTCSKNHAITYNGDQDSEAIWNECRASPVFNRFLIDLSLANDMEKARLGKTRWYNARVHCFTPDNKSGEPEVNAIMEILRGKLGNNVSVSRPSDANDYNVSGLHILKISEVVGQSNDAPDMKDNRASTTTKTQSGTETDARNTKYIEETEGNNWMDNNIDQHVEDISKKVSKKGYKSRSKAKNKPSPPESTLDAKTDDEPSILEGCQPPVNTADPKSLLEEEEIGEWSLVPKKLQPRQSRSQNSSSTCGNQLKMKCTSVAQYRQLGRRPDQVFYHNRSSQVLAQPPRRNTPNTTIPANSKVQCRATTSKTSSVPSLNVVVNQNSQNSAPIQKSGPKVPKFSRAFVPEEYPGLNPKVSTSMSLSTVMQVSQQGPITQFIQNGFVPQALHENQVPSKKATYGSEKKPVPIPKPSAFVTVVSGAETFQDNIAVPIKRTAEKVPASPVTVSPTFQTNDRKSNNASARSNHDDKALENDDLEQFFGEDLSQPLHKLEEFEPSNDRGDSEHSSATLKSDEPQSTGLSTGLGLNANSKQHGREIIRNPVAFSEDQALSSAQKGHGHETDNTITGEPEDSRENTSSVIIWTSPSQCKITAMSLLSRSPNNANDEVVSIEDSSSTLKAKSSRITPGQLEDDVLEIRLNAADKIQDIFVTVSCPEGPTSLGETMSVVNEEEHDYLSGPFPQIPGCIDENPSIILLNEEEAAKAIFTKKIKIRSARLSTSFGGVEIPNYYPLSSDSEDIEAEMPTTKAKPTHAASTKVPKIRSAPHSRKTGKAIPNFFHVSEDDEDTDLEQTAVNFVEQADDVVYTTATDLHANHLRTDDKSQNANYSNLVEASPSFASDLATTVPPPVCNHAPGVIGLAIVLNEYSEDVEPFLEDRFPREVMNVAAVTSTSDVQINPGFSDDSITQEVLDDNPSLDATALDERMGPTVADDNYIQESMVHSLNPYTDNRLMIPTFSDNDRGGNSVCRDYTESAPHQYLIDRRNSILPIHLSHPDGDQSSEASHLEYAESAPDSASYCYYAPHYTCQTDEAAYDPQFADSGLHVAPPSQNFYERSALLERTSVFPGTASTSYDSDVDTSQPVTERGSPYVQSEGQYAGDGASDAQSLVHSRGLSGADTDRLVAKAQTEIASQFTARCTYCRERTTPSRENPQVLCAGCGPASNIRYCSVACLLVNALAHSVHCMNYSAANRAAFYSLPGMFIYVTNPIVSVLGYTESAERYRQRAFSMYCNSGNFPRFFKAWMKKEVAILPGQSAIDVSETGKQTGQYVVFRSNHTLDPPRNNPNANVIYTVEFHCNDPKRQMLSRTLNTCYLVWDSRVIEFLYRLLRHYILDPEYFSLFKYTESVHVVWPEFVLQFKKEFNFDESMQTCAAPFNGGIEWYYISGLISNLEYQNPILSQWFGH